MTTTTTEPLLLFDGVCNVCNFVVQFVLKHERDARMKFASLQSDVGRRIVAERGLSADIDSVILVVGDRAYERSSAAVRVLLHLKAPWSWAAALWIVPRPLRDVGYSLFAHFRYRLFGKRQECMVPTPEIRARFVG